MLVKDIERERVSILFNIVPIEHYAEEYTAITCKENLICGVYCASVSEKRPFLFVSVNT